MSGVDGGGIDSLGTLPPRKPPIQPGDVTTRKELADAIAHIMRGMSSPIGGPSRKDRIEQILAGCDAYAAAQIAEDNRLARDAAANVARVTADAIRVAQANPSGKPSARRNS